MDKFNITLVRSTIKNRPYCKIDGTYRGPTWQNDIGLQAVPYNIKSVYELMIKLSEQPEFCMVYGTAVKPKILKTNRKGNNFAEELIYLLTLDLDKYEGNLKDEYPTYQDCIKESDYFIQNHLPPEFHNSSYILRFSSSFLKKDYYFKVHLVFLLADPQYPREISTWIRRENIPVDPTFYSNLTQPVFTAAPIFKNEIDPLEKLDNYFPRVSLITKENEFVSGNWQPYSVPKKYYADHISELPKATELTGKIGSFCRTFNIEEALLQLGYEDHGEGRYLAPSSQSGLPGAVAFENGYCFSHHEDDPINKICEQVFYSKRKSLNSYDLMSGWSQIVRDNDRDFVLNFEHLLRDSLIKDEYYQKEIMNELIIRTEWLTEGGYEGSNKTIIDQLLKDMQRIGLNELSVNHIFNTIKVKTKIGISSIKNTWKAIRKDISFYTDKISPDTSLRRMADIFMRKNILYSHHGSLRGDFWCYNSNMHVWYKLNYDQTFAYIYNNIHSQLSDKEEININVMDSLIKLILRRICMDYGKFRSGAGWAFKEGKVGIAMNGLFDDNSWTIKNNIRTLTKKDKITKLLPVTLKQWQSTNGIPPKFNDFLTSTCEEDYEKVDLLQEFIGYIFADSYNVHNFMVLEGVPGSGKSILSKILRACISSENYISLSLSRFGKSFGLAEAPNKKLIVTSEARGVDFKDLRAAIPNILKLTGNDPIDIEAKYKSASTERLTAKLLVLTNRAPIFPDDTQALAQRMILLKLHKSFRGTKEEILGLDDTIIKNELPSIIKWAFQGLEKLSKRKKFYIPKSVIHEAQIYFKQTDPLNSYIIEYFRIDRDVHPSQYISTTEFITYFQAYLYQLGQIQRRTLVQKRADIRAVTSVLPIAKRVQVRIDQNNPYYVYAPLIPNTNLAIEFAEERETIENLTMKGELK